MKLTNVYEFENHIRNQLITDGVIDASLIFTDRESVNFSNKNFRDLPDADAVALIIIFEGFDPSKHHSGKGSSLIQRLSLRYRLLVVSPESLYYDNVGVKFVEIAKSIKNITNLHCSDAKMIVDVHEFHLPEYSNNMVVVPQMWQFDVML
jgi:hypothetical protein